MYMKKKTLAALKKHMNMSSNKTYARGMTNNLFLTLKSNDDL